MSEVGELRARLRFVEHDLEHVVLERDRAEAKLAKITNLVSGIDSPLSSWYDSRSTHEAIKQIRRVLRGRL